ncbi:hypothetical protein AWB74_01261 [Caballeronia arvi]|uniref:Uncharacterized protein n=1 Tax=Caballeronia arvi TaxID=1777135 RepID=A0A158G8T2_9BURK|nr:hypothetical protein [Caballeronia arvi]SAL28271.1 hypothetical protein AWB74_01261 [Caballeronia arvi]
MTKKPLRATIVFYDEDSQQVKLISVFRREVQAVIDKEVARSGGMTIPPSAEDRGAEPLTDEDARKLGCITLLMQAGVHPELRERLRLTLAEPINWNKPPKPAE